jgi:hypothetical protein
VPAAYNINPAICSTVILEQDLWRSTTGFLNLHKYLTCRFLFKSLKSQNINLYDFNSDFEVA